MRCIPRRRRNVEGFVETVALLVIYNPRLFESYSYYQAPFESKLSRVSFGGRSSPSSETASIASIPSSYLPPH